MDTWKLKIISVNKKISRTRPQMKPSLMKHSIWYEVMEVVPKLLKHWADWRKNLK